MSVTGPFVIPTGRRTLEQIAKDADRMARQIDAFAVKFGGNDKFNAEIGSAGSRLWDALTAASHVLPRLATYAGSAAECARAATAVNSLHFVT